MYKPVSVALLIAIVLLVFGCNTSMSVSLDVSGVFTGSPVNRAIWMIFGDTLAATAGIIGLKRLSN
ncbi:MAG: Membrane protein [Pedosphaera sp.]|nr:Membrane protein [Pedosphaera sp.]